MKSSKNTKHPYIFENKKKKVPNEKVLTLMPRELVEEFQAFVFNKNGDIVEIAAVNPEHSALQSFVKERFSNNVKWFTANEEDVTFVLQNYGQNFNEDIVRLVKSSAGAANGNIIELVNLIMGYALKEQASDIHVEPGKNESSVRFRVDGILHKVFSLPKDTHQAIVARFKILANLKIDEYRQPQDGRIEFMVKKWLYVFSMTLIKI